MSKLVAVERRAEAGNNIAPQVKSRASVAAIDVMDAIDAIDAGMVADLKAMAQEDADAPSQHRRHRSHGPQFMLPDADQSPIAEIATRSGRPMLTVVGFMLKMAIGGGAAALVFHDRVAAIVSQSSRINLASRPVLPHLHNPTASAPRPSR